MIMERQNKNIMPEINLFPELDAVINQAHRFGRFIGRLVGFLPTEAPDYMSDHYDPLASPVEPVTQLSFTWPSHTWHYPELPEDVDSIEYWRVHHQPDDIYDPQMPFVMNHPEADTGWDSEGNYHDDDLATIIPLFPKDVA